MPARNDYLYWMDGASDVAETTYIRIQSDARKAMPVRLRPAG